MRGGGRGRSSKLGGRGGGWGSLVHISYFQTPVTPTRFDMRLSQIYRRLARWLVGGRYDWGSTG